ncbi:MAG: hypothetical protein U0166_25525 [Acidobacteriota bacterium]
MRNGTLRDPGDPELLLSTDPLRTNSCHIFAVNLEGCMRIHRDGGPRALDQAAVKHESLFHNDDVLGAGEILVVEGVVYDLNDQSGSYGTGGKLPLDPAFREAVRDALDRAGVAYSDNVHQALLPRRSV